MARFKIERLESRIAPSKLGSVCGGGSKNGGSHKGGSQNGGSHNGGSHNGGSHGASCTPRPSPGCVDKGGSC